MSLIKRIRNQASYLVHTLSNSFRSISPEKPLTSERIATIKYMKSRQIRLRQALANELEKMKCRRLPELVRSNRAEKLSSECSRSIPLFLGAELAHEAKSRLQEDGLYIEVKLQDFTEYCCIDSGANLNICSKRMKCKLEEGGVQILPYDGPMVQIYDVNRQRIPQSERPIRVKLEVGGIARLITFHVVDNAETDLLIGYPCLQQLRVVLNFATEPPSVFLLQNEGALAGEMKLFMNNSVTLAPGKWTMQEGETGLRDGIYQTENAKDMLEQYIIVPDQLLEVKRGRTSLVIGNRSNGKITLHKGHPLANLVPLEQGDKIIHKTRAEKVTSDGTINFDVDKLLQSVKGTVRQTKIEPENKESADELDPEESDFLDNAGFTFPTIPITDWRTDIMTSKYCPDNQRQNVINLLEKYQSIISIHEFDIGKLDESFNYKYSIKTGDAIPVKQKPYRLDALRIGQVQRAFNFLEKIGFLKQTDSTPWSSPSFVVPKADGRIRIIFDTRLLNSVTETSTFPLPRIDDIFAEIGASGAKYFTLVDLKAAYYNIELDEDAQKKAAVITPQGCHLPQRLIFGLKNAPSAFSYIINRILDTIPPEKQTFCRAYLDDIVIFSRTQEEHLCHIDKVLAAIQRSGIKIIPSKMQLFQPQVQLLGRIIDRSGIKAVDTYVQKIQKLQPPNNRKELMRLLGFLGWVQNFIYHFSGKIRPLSRLLKSSVPWEWGTQQQTAFEQIKKDVALNTKLYFPTFDEPFYVTTDSSDFSVAGMAYQVRTYLKEEMVKIKEGLEEGQSINDLPKPKFTQHPVFPPSSKRTPKPFVLGKGNVFHPPKENEDTAQHVIMQEANDLLEQDQFHIVLPIAFYSKTLNDTQTRWVIYEKELYSIVQTLKAFEHILAPAHMVYVLTDNATILWTLKAATAAKKSLTNSKINRWTSSLFSLPYKLIIGHTLGKANTAADFLSRIDPPMLLHVTDKKSKTASEVKSHFPVFSIIDREMISAALAAGEQEPVQIKAPFKRIQRLTLRYLGTAIDKSLEEVTSQHTILKAQRQSPHHSRIIENLSKGQKYNRFYLNKEGLLLKRSRIKKQEVLPPRDKIVIPNHLIGRLIAYFHVDNHCGYKALYKLIKASYTAEKLEDKCRDFTTSCHLCCVNKFDHLPKESLSRGAYFPCRKFDLWSVDVVTGLPKYRNSGSFLSCIEYYTSYCLILPLKYETAAEVATLIESRIFAVFGCPKAMLSDGGSNLLVSEKVRRLLNWYSSKVLVSSPYSPKSHGKIERTNYTITTLLRILSQQLDLSWYNICPLAQLAINTRPSKALDGHSPYYFMFGVEPKNKTSALKESDFTDYKEALAHWETVKTHCDKVISEVAIERDKRNLERGGKETNLLHKFVYIRDKRPKLHQKIKPVFYKAPCLVIKDFGKVVLCRTFDGIVKKAHKDNIKVFSERSAELYQELPIEIKERIGDATDLATLTQLCYEGKLPDIYKNEILKLERAKTRLQERQEREEAELRPVNPYIPTIDNPRRESSSSSSDDDDDEAELLEKPVEPPKVTFDLPDQEEKTLACDKCDKKFRFPKFKQIHERDCKA